MSLILAVSWSAAAGQITSICNGSFWRKPRERHRKDGSALDNPEEESEASQWEPIPQKVRPMPVKYFHPFLLSQPHRQFIDYLGYRPVLAM